MLAELAAAGGAAASKTFWRRLVWRDLAYWQVGGVGWGGVGRGGRRGTRDVACASKGGGGGRAWDWARACASTPSFAQAPPNTPPPPQLWHWPSMPSHPIRQHYAALAWAPDPGDAALAAWQRGRTGFPLVDAGMRQLWQTGW